MSIKAENWVGEYTSTVGDGDIILGGQIDGFCGFANVGDNVDVYYTIMDALNKETGIGTVIAGKLVRKTIHAVLLDGTYIKGGSPLMLSGDAQVYLTANSHFMDYVVDINNSLTDAIDKINAINTVTINGNPLQGHILLDAQSVGARPADWLPTAEDIGTYSKSASDNRYLASAKAEGSTDPDYKVIVTDGPTMTALNQKIDQADQTLQQNIDNVAVTFIGPNPPQNAPEGKKWYDTNSGRSYIYLNDGDSLQWVEESPQGNGLVDTSPLLIAMANSKFGQLGNRNLLINGDFRIWQRGVVVADSATPKYCADRFLFQCSGTAFSPYVLSDEQDMPLRTGMQIGQTAGNTGFAIIQRVEKLNCNFVNGEKLTFSFYTKGTVARTIQCSIKSANAADDFSATTAVKATSFNVAAGGAWQRFSVTFDATAACLNGLEVRIDFDATNGLAAGIFSSTGWQLEKGEVATPFEYRHIALEMQLCLRYYFKPTWTAKQVFFKNLTWSSQPLIFPVEMRVTPRAIALTTAQILGDTAGMTMQPSKQAFFYSFSNGNPGVVEVGLAFDAEL